MSLNLTVITEFHSTSPPRRDQSTINTPSAQKRFNPFMKDSMMGKNKPATNSFEATKYPGNTSPLTKPSLSPTTHHPLMDLEAETDTDDEYRDDCGDTFVVKAHSVMKPNNVVPFVELSPEVSQTPAEPEASVKITQKASHPDDDHHNNNSAETQPEADTSEGEHSEKSDPTKENLSLTNNNNTTNVNNNNHVPDTNESEQSIEAIEESDKKSEEEKLDGECFEIDFGKQFS